MFVRMRVREGQSVVVQGVKRGGGELVIMPAGRAAHLINAGLVDHELQRAWVKTKVDLCLKQAKGGNPALVVNAGDLCEISGNQAVKLVASGKAEFAAAPVPLKKPKAEKETYPKKDKEGDK